MKPAGSYSKLLVQPSFIYYLISQFITAFNDNAFKIVVMLLALETPESGYVDMYYIGAQLVFTLPFFLFSGYAGFFTDKHPKNKVIIATKALEVIIMFLAMYFLVRENKPMLIFVLFLLSTQSVFLSPAKYGILPEWFPEEDISRANGIVELVTFLAIIIGSALGGILMQKLGDDLLIIGIFLLISALIGFGTSFGMKDVVMSGAKRKINANPLDEIIKGIMVIYNNRLLATTIAGISFFFAMGLAVTTNLMVFGKELLDLTEMQLGLLNASMGLGIGVGSIAAGWLSGDKIEYGLIPMGALGLTFSIFGIAYTTASITTLYVILMLCGLFAGLFIVPLNALLQELPDAKEKGRLIATNNFFNGAAMVIAVLLIWFLQGGLHLKPDSIMLVLAWITLIFSVMTLMFNPRFFVRFVILLVTHIFYRIDVVGSPHIPRDGPALIVSNHVSYIDGVVLSTVFPRFIRYLAHRDYYDNPLLNPLMRFAYAIPIESGSEQKVEASITRARQALAEGHVVCIFAEGRLTRTGNLLPFKTGLEKITEGLDVPIIPVHLDQLWDTFFSPRKEGQLFRWPQQIPARITVTLGEPMPADSKAWQVREAVQGLAVEARISGYQRQHYLSVKFLKTAKAYPYRYCIYNNETKASYSYAKFSTQALYVANKFKHMHIHENRIGVLLPCCYNSALINTAITLTGKSVVNIPSGYTYEQVLELKKRLGIISIYAHNMSEVGKRLIAESSAFDINAVVNKLSSTSAKAKQNIIGCIKYIIPAKLMVSILGRLPESPESELSVIVPDNLGNNHGRFVIVSHESIYNNISGLKQILQLTAYDRAACFINYDNPFSYTANLWTCFIVGCGQVPIDPELSKDSFIQESYKQHATLLIGTRELFVYCLENIATNLLGFLRYIVCIDDIEDELIEEFYDKFGLRIMGGFGIKELGPFVSLNTPNVRRKGILQRGMKRGSKGHPLPNVALRIVDPKTGEVLGPNIQGTLEVKTPAHMLGDIDSLTSDGHTLTARVNQWFRTEYSNAVLDEDGFLFID